MKRWLESIGIYPIGADIKNKPIPPCGYYEKRWGGGFSKEGLPDMHFVVNAISIDVELKASNGRVSELQKHNICQINQSGSIGVILYPEGFETFKKLVQGVMSCSGHIQGLNVLKNVLTSTKCDILTEY